MVMHSAIYAGVAAADKLPSCPTCGRYLTNYPDGLRCDRCTLGPVFADGATVKLEDGTLAQVNRAVFRHGQWRYCLAVADNKPFVWAWEGHLRGQHGATYGRP